MGTKRKFWFDDNRRLFKQGRTGTGENWAEVGAASLAGDLGLPHARYGLATYEGQQGVVTENFVPSTGRLVFGNELVGIATGATGLANNRRMAHTVRRIGAVVGHERVGLPPGWNSPIGALLNAKEVMCGYLLLDALIGNQDRHEENWGLLIHRGSITLAPTFDHASSLGRNESDETRLRKLETINPDHGMEGFARRAKTPIYGEGGARLGTIEAFSRFAELTRDRGEFWLSRLQELDHDHMYNVLARVPDDWISPIARRFSVKLLETNRLRLLETL